MIVRLFLMFFVALVLAGCSGDEIETVQVTKEPAAPPVEAPAPVELGFRAELPAGWVEQPGSGMRIVSYSIEGSEVDFYLISLLMGDVPSNVNRWRGQVGLEPASPEAIDADVQTFSADGHDVKLIEIYNEESGWGIISAIVDLAPEYWYFTAKGPVSDLKENVGDIRKFIQSLEI